MKKLIIAGLLAATLTSAQAARFEWMNAADGASGTTYDIAKGSFREHNGVISLIVRSTRKGYHITVEQLMVMKSDCNGLRAHIRLHDMATGENRDETFVRGSGSVGDHLVNIACSAATNSL